MEDNVKRIFNLITMLLICTSILSGCGSQKEKEPIKKTEFVLGTIVDIQIYDEKDILVVDKVMSRLREIENDMTINRDKSDLQDLNNNSGVPYRVKADTYEVVKRALYYSEISNGNFDMTIGPLIKLWNIGSDNPRLPEFKEIEDGLSLVNYKDVVLMKDQTILLKKKGMIIDLGSIAKGYAADEAVKIMKDNGVKKAILNLGGNIYALGSKANGQGWKIGIQDPYSDRGEYLGIVTIKDETVVTSGIYERYFEKDGIRYHHILDPKTGYPVENNVASVTIVSSSSIDADGLSTTLFVLGVEEGLKLVESLDNVDAVFITKDKEISVSSGLKDNFQENK